MDLESISSINVMKSHPVLQKINSGLWKQESIPNALTKGYFQLYIV